MVLFLLFLWLLLSTTILLIEATQPSTTQDQSAHHQKLFKQRLSILSLDQDVRAQETLGAQQRYNVALAEVSQMQSTLLASDGRLRELGSEIEVIQKNLRRTIKE
jgi:hypothetical protein